MDRVGIHEGNVFKYHQARRNTRNYQVDLETLQYDLLYGKQYTYGGANPFERTKMRMGIYDTTLDSIQVVSETDHTYYIQGTNFTPSSQVKINGEWYDTVYVNPTKLIITGKELDDFEANNDSILAWLNSLKESDDESIHDVVDTFVVGRDFEDIYNEYSHFCWDECLNEIMISGRNFSKEICSRVDGLNKIRKYIDKKKSTSYEWTR